MLPRHPPGIASRAQTVVRDDPTAKIKNCGAHNAMCAGRESNSGLVRGRDVHYHFTTGADVSISQCAFHSALPASPPKKAL